MADQRRAGFIQFQVAGIIQDAKGHFTYGLGVPKFRAYYGPNNEYQGSSSTPTTAFIEGTITDRGTQSLSVTLHLANGKTIILANADWAGEGVVSTEEAEIPVRWEGGPCHEIGRH